METVKTEDSLWLPILVSMNPSNPQRICTNTCQSSLLKTEVAKNCFFT